MVRGNCGRNAGTPAQQEPNNGVVKVEKNNNITAMEESQSCRGRKFLCF
jgi:hypothetical protein